MEISGYHHTSAALLPRKEIPVPVEHKTVWAQESILTLWRRENYLPLPRTDSWSSMNYPGFSQNLYWWILCTDIVTDSMEQSSSWEAHSRSVSQEIDHILWKVHYLVHIQRSPPPALLYCLTIHFNIVLPSTRKYSKRSLPFRLSNDFIRISQM
jgi:hypothetical protein